MPVRARRLRSAAPVAAVMARLPRGPFGRDLVRLWVLAALCNVTSALLSIWVAFGPRAVLMAALLMACLTLGMMGGPAVAPARLLRRWRRPR
ncbi:MAG: hypothetical protein ACYDEA_03480 [Candidatus Dormibacteria bacterium]